MRLGKQPRHHNTCPPRLPPLPSPPGGQDRRIMLWNPFSQKPLATMQGHTSSVMSIVVNDDNNQIISLAADKQIKVRNVVAPRGTHLAPQPAQACTGHLASKMLAWLADPSIASVHACALAPVAPHACAPPPAVRAPQLWDVRNHKCIQTISDRQPYPMDDTLLSMCYDTKRKTLITGADLGTSLPLAPPRTRPRGPISVHSRAFLTENGPFWAAFGLFRCSFLSPPRITHSAPVPARASAAQPACAPPPLTHTPTRTSTPPARAGNLKPKLWRQTVTSVASATGPPVVRIMYNSNFTEVGGPGPRHAGSCAWPGGAACAGGGAGIDGGRGGNRSGAP